MATAIFFKKTLFICIFFVQRTDLVVAVLVCALSIALISLMISDLILA